MTRAFYITCDDKTEHGTEYSTEDLLAALLEYHYLVNLTIREVTP